MQTSLSAYTNLESLLLFQCLHAYGVDTPVWARISDLLTKAPDVTQQAHFQPGRLSPDALRAFYLDRLRNELAHEQASHGDGPHGSGSGGGGGGRDVTAPSGKRKRQTPPLPTVAESLKHQHLIPKLVTKLYASYRTELTAQIRADEDHYDALQRDIHAIQRASQPPSHPAQPPTQPPSQSPSQSSHPLPAPPSRPSQPPSQPASPKHAHPAPNRASNNTPTPTPDPAPPSLAHDTRNGHHVPPLPPPRHKEPPPSDQQRGPSTPRLPAIAPSPHPDPTQGPSPAPPPAFQQPLQPSPHHGQPFPPPQQGHAPHSHPHPGPHQSVIPLAHGHAGASPGPHFQPSFPPPYGANGSQHYGPPSGPPSEMPPHPAYHPPYRQQQPHGPHSPGIQATHQQQRTQYTHAAPPPPAPHHPQISLPPPQAGFMLPPFQVSPQDPSRVHHPPHAQQPYPPVSTPVSHRQQSAAAKPQLQTPGPARQGLPPVHPLITQARQSFSTPTSSSSPQSANGTPVSAKSVWKRQSSSNAPENPASPRPEVEPLDDVPPLIRSAPSPPKTVSPRKSRVKTKDRDKDNDKDEEQDKDEDNNKDKIKVKEKEKEKEKDKAKDKDKGKGKELDEDTEQVSTLHAPPGRESRQRNRHEDESLLDPEPRTGRSRRKGPMKQARPGSLASSRAGGSVQDRSRSRSILSHTETIAGDNESQSGHRIKSERGTSVEPTEEEITETPSHATRRRRRAAAPTVPTSTRRKRNARDASLEEPDDQFSTPGPPKTIHAQRHFSRMCAPIMNDINSHKHASTFTTAVRAKDAEGYYDIIKRPTDLKSIQKAIATGAKQVAAAATDTPAGSPGGAGGGVVELPNTSDHCPPKSIVNAGQLEKELMRMFVNAVMFNPGEDGVVEDAREMFKTVEQSVSNWRNVERSSGRTEIEDTPQAEDDEGGQPSKRRKI